MKKLKTFLVEYGLIFIILFLCAVVVVGLVLPLFIALARLAWDVAINNPQALI